MPTPSASDVRVFAPAKDLEQSLCFYTALGWTENWRGEGLAIIELAGNRLYLQAYYVKAWAENFMLYVDVDDAAAWHEHAKSVIESGEFPGTRVQAPKRQGYGATVTFVHDPAGVLIHFGQWD